MTILMSRDSDSLDGESRRSFIKYGALTTGALTLGLGGAGSVAGQTETATPSEETSQSALIANEKFYPGALFRVASPVLDQPPDEESIPDDRTVRRIEYLNTDETVQLYPPRDANLTEGNVYKFIPRFEPAENVRDASVITVFFEPVREALTGSDNLYDQEDGLEMADGGGNAVMSIDNFNPGALLLVTTGVISEDPTEVPENLRSNYDSHLVEYLNTGEDFLLYPAHDANVQEGGVYRVDDQFDIVRTRADLVITRIDRVNEQSISNEFQ
jgi:hypothetical protein